MDNNRNESNATNKESVLSKITLGGALTAIIEKYNIPFLHDYFWTILLICFVVLAFRYKKYFFLYIICALLTPFLGYFDEP